MAIIKKENILKVLAGFNPWWKTGAVALRFLKATNEFPIMKHWKKFLIPLYVETSFFPVPDVLVKQPLYIRLSIIC